MNGAAMTGWTGPLVGPRGFNGSQGMWKCHNSQSMLREVRCVVTIIVDWVVEVLLKIRTCHYKEDLDFV